MKQTAVEWLIDELNKSIGLTKFVEECDEEYKNEILTIIQQAKAMEKEQTLVDYSCGARDTILNIDFVDAVKYYNKTYGGKK